MSDSSEVTTPRRRGGAQVVPRPAVVGAGPPPPWATGPVTGLDAVLAHVRDVERPLVPAFDGARSSAVLVPLRMGAHGTEVLLTRRSQTMRHHRGEISFPGGRMDPGETPLDTALREAHEEVGLDPDAVRVIGELDHLNTVVSRSYIVPKVAVVDPAAEVRPMTGELDRTMWVPLDELVATHTYHGEVWGAPPTDRLLHFFELVDETVWGATGHMLFDLLARPHR